MSVLQSLISEPKTINLCNGLTPIGAPPQLLMSDPQRSNNRRERSRSRSQSRERDTSTKRRDRSRSRERGGYNRYSDRGMMDASTNRDSNKRDRDGGRDKDNRDFRDTDRVRDGDLRDRDVSRGGGRNNNNSNNSNNNNRSSSNSRMKAIPFVEQSDEYVRKRKYVRVM